MTVHVGSETYALLCLLIYGKPMAKDNAIRYKEKRKITRGLINYWLREYPSEKDGILKCTYIFKGKIQLKEIGGKSGYGLKKMRHAKR